jgi:hypothetical protein
MEGIKWNNENMIKAAYRNFRPSLLLAMVCSCLAGIHPAFGKCESELNSHLATAIRDCRIDAKFTLQAQNPGLSESRTGPRERVNHPYLAKLAFKIDGRPVQSDCQVYYKVWSVGQEACSHRLSLACSTYKISGTGQTLKKESIDSKCTSNHPLSGFVDTWTSSSGPTQNHSGYTEEESDGSSAQ